MKNQQIKYQFINPERYDQYIANLPTSTQLRFIAKTALDGNRGYIVPMPHESGEHTLVVPYYLFNSYIIDEDDNNQIIKGFAKETGEQIASKAVLKETCYRQAT